MKKKIVVLILIALTITGGVFSVYFKLKVNKVNEINKELEAKVDTLNKEIEELKISKEDTKLEEPKVEEETKNPFDINLEKCLNDYSENKAKYEVLSKDSNLGIYMYVTNDRKAANVSIDKESLKKYYDLEWKDSYNSITVNNFSNEIVDMCISSLGGQAVGSEVALFLMKDGTVEFIPLYNALKDDNFKSWGKIAAISDIVKIETATVTTSEGFGYSTPVALKKDGSFYNLYTLLNEYVR